MNYKLLKVISLIIILTSIAVLITTTLILNNNKKQKEEATKYNKPWVIIKTNLYESRLGVTCVYTYITKDGINNDFEEGFPNNTPLPIKLTYNVGDTIK